MTGIAAHARYVSDLRGGEVQRQRRAKGWVLQPGELVVFAATSATAPNTGAKLAVAYSVVAFAPV
jgi:hypothetical protein